MSSRNLSIAPFRHLHKTGSILRSSETLCGTGFSTPFVYARRHVSSESLPAIVRPSFWRSLTPKFLRSGGPTQGLQKSIKKEWNPATFFIVIFLLIGSQAIQILTLHRSYDAFSNQAEAKLTSLREVVKRVQSGEDFDIKAALGTGQKAKEREWEEGKPRYRPMHKWLITLTAFTVIRELEEEDALFQSRRKKRREASHATDEILGTRQSK